MCGPLALAAAVTTLGVAKSVTEFVGQQQAYHDNRIAANLQFANTSNVAQMQAEQTDVKQSQDTVSNVIDAAQRFGRIASSATTLGLGQGTVGSAVNASAVGTGRRQAAIDFNAQSERNQVGTEIQGASLKRTSQINSVQKGTVLGLGMGIAQSALGGFSAYGAAGGKDIGGDIGNIFRAKPKSFSGDEFYGSGEYN